MRQSHLERTIWDRDEFSADTHSVWTLSEHAFKWTLSPPLPPATRGFLNSLSCQALHQTRQQQQSGPSFTPSPPFSTSVFKSFSSLTFYFLWSTSPKTCFISSSWWTHLHFLEKDLASYSRWLLLPFKPPSWKHHINPLVSCLPVLFIYFFPSSDFRTRRWETTSWWSEHQSCQSALGRVHPSPGELLHYVHLIHYDHALLGASHQ